MYVQMGRDSLKNIQTKIAMDLNKSTLKFNNRYAQLQNVLMRNL